MEKGEFHLVGKMLCSNVMESITGSIIHWMEAPFHRNLADSDEQVRLDNLK